MKMIEAIMLAIIQIWFIAGMFVGVGLFVLLAKPILSFFLCLFAIGLILLCIFLLLQFGKLNRNDKDEKEDRKLCN